MNIAQRPLARFVAGLTLSAFALGTLAPVAGYRHRLIFDLYPTIPVDPIAAMIE